MPGNCEQGAFGHRGRVLAPGAGRSLVRVGWRHRAFALRATLEVATIATLFAFYRVGRLAIQGQEAVALSHAEAVHRVESTLQLPSEAALQEAAGAIPNLFEVANVYYFSLHFPVMIAFLAWEFLARPSAEYRSVRRALVATTFIALGIHLLFPLAPPRMLSEAGFIDTMSTLGPSPYDGASATVANQYAAMPSLHVGWALLIALALYRTGQRQLGRLAAAHAVLTVIVVVITANHWWLDGVVAAALVIGAMRLCPQPPRPDPLQTGESSYGDTTNVEDPDRPHVRPEAHEVPFRRQANPSRRSGALAAGRRRPWRRR